MWPSIWEWSGYRLQTHQGFCCGSVTIISFFIMHLLTGNCAFLQLPLSKTFPSVFFMFFLSLPSRKYKLRSTKKKVTWSMACEEKPDRSCDLTDFDLHYLGIYVLRVRANLNGNHSDWVQKEFCPDKEGELERERGGGWDEDGWRWWRRLFHHKPSRQNDGRELNNRANNHKVKQTELWEKQHRDYDDLCVCSELCSSELSKPQSRVSRSRKCRSKQSEGVVILR